VLGWKLGQGLQYWCNSVDVLQIGIVVFCTGSSVSNPVPIIGLFSYSPSSNQTSYLRGVLYDNQFRFDYQYYL
jgi:hypothetical protein